MISIVEKFHDVMRNFQSQARSVGRDIDSLRDRIVALKEERRKIETQQTDYETARKRLAVMVGQMNTGGYGAGPAIVRSLAAAKPLPQGYGFLTGGPDDREKIAWGLADAIEAKLGRELEALYQDDPGITDAERERRVAAIDRDIRDLEFAEEALIRGCDEIGVHIARRPDADPAAILDDGEGLPTQ